MHQDRVELLLKFDLSVAADQDLGNQELGVIHLIKLLYLADVAYAEQHAGASFTGIPWVFYHFGPWCQAAYLEVERVLSQLAITPRRFQAREFEVKRYVLPPDHWLKGEAEELGRGIPVEVYSACRRSIRLFGSDTESLLHHVYKTPPMLQAAPGEQLDLRYCVVPKPPMAAEPKASLGEPLSKTQAKRKEARRLEMKLEIQSRIQARIQERERQRVQAPMDAEYLQLMAILNEEDAFGSLELKGTITFDQSFWESDFRRECGLS